MRNLSVDGRMGFAAGAWGIDLLGGNGDAHSADGWLASTQGLGEQISAGLIVNGAITLGETALTEPTLTRFISRPRRPYRPPRQVSVEVWARLTVAGTRTVYAAYAVDNAFVAEIPNTLTTTDWKLLQISVSPAVREGEFETVRFGASPDGPVVEIRGMRAVAAY